MNDNIYKALIYIDDFYDKMDDSKCYEFMTVLLDIALIISKGGILFEKEKR